MIVLDQQLLGRNIEEQIWHVWYLAWLLEQGRYNRADVARMHAVAHAERARAATTAAAASTGDRALRARLFGADHPYAQRGRPIADALEALTGADLERWRRARYRGTGATLIVSGGFDRDAMHKHVVDLFGAIGKRTPPARAALPRPHPATGPSWIGTREPDEPQISLYVSFTAGSDRDRDHAARQVLSEMIADRLRVVREGMGASYGVSSGYNERAAASVLRVYAALDPARAPKAAAAVVAALTALPTDPQAAAADFVRARRRLGSDALASSIDVEAVATRLDWAVRHGGDLRRLSTVASDLATVTLDQVAAVAQADLDPARMVVSVDGQPAAAKATLDALGATDVAWFDE